MAVPNNTKEILMEGQIDGTTDTLKVALLNNQTAYTFDENNHAFVSDVIDAGTTGTEFSGGSYSRQTLNNVTVEQDDPDNEGVLDADDTTFSSLDTQDIQTIIIYKQVGGDDTTPGDDPIVAVLDDDSAGSLGDLPLTTNGSDVTISWNAEGILNIT
jgi:hypothetical protein